MTTLEVACAEMVRYAAERGIRLTVSGVYDLFPALPRAAPVVPSACWPDRWPQGGSHGVYLFFSDVPSGPELLYVGKSSKPSSCIRTRLNGYVDLAEYRASGRCVLREEWHGYHRPWGTPPRFVVTAAIQTGSTSGECPEAEKLERYLIRALRPSENVVGRVVGEAPAGDGLGEPGAEGHPSQ